VRHVRRGATVISATALAVLATAPAASGGAIPGHYIVVLNDSVSAPGAVASEHGKKYGVEASHVYRHALKGYAAKVPQGQLDDLQSDDRVLFVAADRKLTLATKPGPSPPPPACLSGGGCLPASVDRVDGDLSTAASGNGSGEVDVDIAILDDGIDATHPDLNVVGGTDCTVPNNSKKGHVGEHGTFVSGVAAAKDNGFGVVGVAPGARLWDVRVSGPKQSFSSNLICGIDFVAATRTDSDPDNDIEVANHSHRGKGSDDPTCGASPANDPLHQAMCASVATGVVHVASAGNNSDDFQKGVPAAYDEVLTATGMADYDGQPGGLAAGCPIPARHDPPDDTVWPASSFATLAADSAHTLSAPAVCVLSTNEVGTGRWGDYGLGDGTSFSAPNIAGAVALCIASGECAGLTPAEIIDKFVADAAAYNTANPDYGFLGDPLHSPDPGKYYGFLIRAGEY
jgi:subtilisin